LLARLEEADAGWRARVAVAEARQERWVYRASFEDGRARLAPERLPRAHAFAGLAPCENALVLHSAYYRAAPLTIAGPGAGIDLTAAGVLGDLFAAAQRHRGSRTREVAQPVGVAA
jgi:homoserine dehydrogenase